MAKTLLALTAALAIAMPAAALAAQTDTGAKAKQPVLDRTVTGSVERASDCAPTLFAIQSDCNNVGGGTNKFPSAPTNPQFGF